MTVFTIGSTIGVLIQVQLATGNKFMPPSAISGHAGAQIIGYLVTIALAISDWGLSGAPRSKSGFAQVILLFVAAILGTLGALLDIQPLLIAFIPLEIAALVLFLVRLGGRVVSPRSTAAAPARHFAIAVPFLLVNVALIIYFILGVTALKIYADFAAVPRGIFIAADHAIFIGAMTNANFGRLLTLNAARRSLWPWADGVVFWGTNLGLAGFLVVLLTNATDLKRIIVPIMGASILLGLLVNTLRLRSGPAAAEARAAA